MTHSWDRWSGWYGLFDLYGAPSGSTGVFALFFPLGIELKLSKVFFLVLNPLGLAVPAPQLRGVPFVYPQYRATLDLETFF